MGKRGPAPGHGGRPRTPSPAKRSDGYTRITVGPKSDGHQVYEHRANAGLGNVKGSKSQGQVVDHKDRQRSNNAKSNLRITTKKGNANNRG